MWALQLSWVYFQVLHIVTPRPCYITFLLSAALILDTEFSIKSDSAASREQLCARRSSVSARDHWGCGTPSMQHTGRATDTSLTRGPVMEHLSSPGGRAHCPAALSLQGHSSWRSLGLTEQKRRHSYRNFWSRRSPLGKSVGDASGGKSEAVSSTLNSLSEIQKPAF